MEGVIDKLIELEYKAKKITSEAKEKEKTLSEQIQKKQEETEKWILEQYKEKTEQMKKNEKLDQQKKIEEINKKKLTHIKELEKAFEQNHLEWENTLFSTIIGW